MKILIPQPELQTALELITRITTKHVTLPVLQCVLIEAKQNKVTLRATNLELNIEISLKDVQVEVGGIAAVPAQILLQSIQFIKHKTITCVINDSILEISAGKNKTRINTQPVGEFPTISKQIGEGSVLSGSSFSVGIKTVASSASISSIKPELGSVFVQQKKEHSLTFVATDSFRLMEKTVPQKGLILQNSFMIPTKNALELAKVCDTLKTNPTLVVSEEQCALIFEDGVYISSRLVTGSFPDYEQIIPKEYTTHTTVLRTDLQHILKKTSFFLNKFMQVTINVKPTELQVTAQNGEVGVVTDGITVQTEGEELTLNFNQNYLQEPLNHIHDDSLAMHFAGIGRPLVINGVSDTTVRYLVMPMNR